MDPARSRQLQELEEVELCVRIWIQSRNELYVSMPFLDVAVSSLTFEADWSRAGLAADGRQVLYGPDFLFSLYERGRVLVNRALLHMLLHCLFCHMYTRGGRDKAYWDLACDIAVEWLIDGLLKPCLRVPPSARRRELYLRIRRDLEQRGGAKKQGQVTSATGTPSARETALTAQRIYKILKKMDLDERRMSQLAAEFRVDGHDLWEQGDPQASLPRQNMWQDNREKVQTAMEAMGGEDPGGGEPLLDSLRVENRERYDYRRFLRKFSVLREEVQVDPDSFDYAYYAYGLSLYGNMPLMEPLESREISRIEEFAIVIDTSMSCSGELILRFLEETYDVLSESESYFRKICIHIIQCDDQVRADTVIRDREELRGYMEEFQIQGYGGTDFRPAFAYVTGLKKSGKAPRLRGLIYFTDGKGIYPVQAPPYDAAFVFVESLFSDEGVPPWAMKVVLEEEQIMEYKGRAEQ